LLVAFGFFYIRSNRERSDAQRLATERAVLAQTDALTGLGNRRALMADLSAAFATHDGDYALALYDLDGFKYYNDSFGHPAGDALLERLADRLMTTLQGIGTAYRMGGDEFCVLARADGGDGDAIARLGAAALTEDGEEFEIGCSYGLASMPLEATSPEAALALADQRMYAQKRSGRVSATRQSTDVLLKVLSEQSTELGHHIDGVARLAQLTAERLGLEDQETHWVRLAAELHDVGKTAIPAAILNKVGPLSDEEWRFMRRHTIIGERIILAAPALAPAARLVRSSHERIDGTGYPDQLPGSEIPRGSRIVAVCDAFDAMVSDRPYSRGVPVRDALAELRRCSGTQFDAEIVRVFVELVQEIGYAPEGSHPAPALDATA
jgi:two-component system, cell cycle response regulator